MVPFCFSLYLNLETMLICTFPGQLFMQNYLDLWYANATTVYLNIFQKEKLINTISSPCQFDCNQMQQDGREIDTFSLKNVLLLNVMEMKNGYSSRCKKKF